MVAATAKKFAQRPSELLKIQNDALALDFDFACGIVLNHFEGKKDLQKLKLFKIQFKNALNEWWNNEPDSLAEIGNDDSDDEL